MSDTEDRGDPAEYIRETFVELRRLYNDGWKSTITDEVIYMTRKLLHEEDCSECLDAARALADARVFGPEEDVIDAHLSRDGEITDRAAEAIVRRLANARGVMETAYFDGWLRIFGFEPLTRKR